MAAIITAQAIRKVVKLSQLQPFISIPAMPDAAVDSTEFVAEELMSIPGIGSLSTDSATGSAAPRSAMPIGMSIVRA